MRWLFWLLALSSPASAQGPELDVRLGCEAAPAPGRVRCDLSILPPAGAVLGWTDALVVRTPEFARPLRSRIAPRDRKDAAQRSDLPFALIATGTGRGELAVRARAVVCRGSLCRPISRDVTIELVVGQPP